ncbi:glutathione S-transferase [Apiosordaria backusii]|uniref:Glutathione S-transferase n=1 Tax=Apiosordaria backusii TaxID=314023 RepID=A0AA40BL66_9PEZI|nr:glutathione S-transferase [Apiosordaria backusii]
MSSLPDLTLYYFPGACSQAVRTTLHELSLPFKSVVVRFDANRELEAADGSLSAKEYRDQIHHSSYVPGFVITFPDGRKESITEAPAILSYLASLVPEKNLAGKTELEKAKVLSWIIWFAGTAHGSAFTPYWSPKRFVDVSDQKLKEGVEKGGRRNIEAAYENLEKRLQKSGGEWFVGDELTLADIYSYIIYRWGVKENFGMEKYKKYTEIVRKLEARESVKKTLEEEGIPAHFQ